MSEFDKNKGDFESLVGKIQSTSSALQEDARLVINRNVTTRAWLTGFYIVEYEQHGNDRAKYGDKLLKRLAERLDDKSLGLASLKNYRQFYLYYPDLAHPIAKYLQEKIHKSQAVFVLSELADNQQLEKSQSLISLFQQQSNQRITKSQSPISLSDEPKSDAISKDGFAMQTANGDVMAVPQMLFDRLSFTHIVQLIHINNPLKRAFYAIEAMRGPVGLLLCTEYGQEMVEYVTPNIDPNVFVAQYELQLPSKEKIKEFLMKENKG